MKLFFKIFSFFFSFFFCFAVVLSAQNIGNENMEDDNEFRRIFQFPWNQRNQIGIQIIALKILDQPLINYLGSFFTYQVSENSRILILIEVNEWDRLWNRPLQTIRIDIGFEIDI